MAVFRVNKNRNYTVMSNYHLRDKSLSLKAKGLLSQMLSLPEDWDYTVQGLCAINKENETAINSTLKELKVAGYLIVTKKMPDKTTTGRIEYVYDIYETPKQEGEKQDLENQGVEFQGVEFQCLENQGQLNTEELSTEETSTEERNKDNLKEKYTKKEISLLVQEFKIIWARYPRHEGKQNALKSYIKARQEGVDMVTIKDAVEAYRRMCENERRDKRYIKQGSTWFNQRSWEDEYGTTKTLGAGTSCENSEFDKYDDTEVPF